MDDITTLSQTFMGSKPPSLESHIQSLAKDGASSLTMIIKACMIILKKVRPQRAIRHG
jgi:hypothetical protein